jgi:hypothetical protein
MSAFAAGAWLLSGCQSNTLYFATNTQLGVRVGVDSKQIPEVELGYNRQEGVVLPLTVENCNKATNSPQACALNGGSATIINDSKFTGENKTGGIKDAPSVIAIFTGHISGSGSASASNSVAANMKVNQYFATGVAAQLLAQHGPAVVGGAPSTTNAQTLVTELQAETEKARAAIFAYVTQPDNSLDTNRVKAITGTNAPPFPPNDVASFLANSASTNLAGFKSRLSTGGPWVPELLTWYSTYTNIIATPKP